jgi:peptide/nickel transport system substrate-binding protein
VKNKLLLGLLILVLVSLPFLGACAKEAATPAPTPTSTPTTTTSPTTTSKYGGTLRIIASAEITSFFPPDQVGPEDIYQRLPSVETLVRQDEKGIVVPFLAESYENDYDANAIIFTLRKGVNFQDGTVCDAEAIKWNLDQLMASPRTGIGFASVSSIEVVDDYKVKISFSQWDNSWLSATCREGMVSPTAFKENDIEWMRNNPVGTGPFKLVSWQRDVNKVFEKWDGYWQEGKPYLDKIEINIIADPMVQIASFRAGENDILLGINPTDADTIKDNPNVNISTSSINGYTFGLFCDSANPDSPFSDLLVRQAASYAIKRQAIVDNVFLGFGKVTYQTNTPECWSNNPDVAGHPYNPDKARELLEEAGYGKGFSYDLYIRPEQVFQDIFTAVQADLSAVGITLNIKTLGVGAYNDMYFGTGWIGGVFGAMIASSPGLSDLARGFFDSSSCLPSLAQSIIHPEEMNDACKQLNSAPDFETQQAASRELQYILCDKYCIVPIIGFLPAMVAKSSKVHDEYSGDIQSAPYTFADAWIMD